MSNQVLAPWFSAPGIAAWRRAGRALRASGWWYFAVLPLVGLVGEPRGEENVLPRVLCAVLVAAGCLAYAYGLNGITDRGMDRDAGKNSLAGLAGLPREAVVLVAACALGAVSLAAMLTPVALLGASVSLVAATFYSAHLRLKRLPVVGTLVNVLIFAPLPLLAATGRPSLRMQFLTYCFWLLVTQNQILHEIADGREDATGGVRTTGVAAGTGGLRAIAFILGPLGVLPLWRMQTAPAALSAAALGLCTGATMVALCTPQRAGQLRVAHRWFSLGVGVVLFALVARRSA
jgi:4-hydroxybenzoate polyprenyltransferase